MEKETKKTILQFLGAILLIVVIIGGLMFLTREPNLTDAEKFKEEYESLNGTVRESDGETYGSISIPVDNPIKYVTAKEAIEILDNETALIYFGASWCPWCRNAVPVLLELAAKYDVENIYYMELDDIKSTYEVKNGSLLKTKSGTDDYYELLDKLADHLDDYIITENGKDYDTGEKRVYLPYVLAIKDGEIVKDKVGTVSLDSGQSKYDNLTDAQHEQLIETYGELFELVYGKTGPDCDEEVCS